MDKMITFLLKDALTDIENLQDYYGSQKNMFINMLKIMWKSTNMESF